MIQHVMLRGIERGKIFVDSDDHEVFANRLDRLIPELGFRCFASVFMPNHVHLALKTADAPLARLMARLGTSYATYFNRRHRRVGHLFQNRYKARLVVDEADLAGLVIYIHQNPLRAGLVADLDALSDLPWTSHGACIGVRPARAFESVAETLALFASHPVRARQRMLRRMGKAGDPPGSFAATSPTPIEGRSVPRPTPDEPEPPDGGLDELIEAVCKSHGISIEELASTTKDRRIVAGRTAVARQAVRDLGLPGRTVASRLGISESAVSRALRRAAPRGGRIT